MSATPYSTDELAALLDEERDDYCAMHAAGLEQRACLDRDDMAGVSAALARANTLMGRIRLRRARLPGDLATRSEQQLVLRTNAIRDAIVRVEELRRANQRTVERLLVETRGDLHRASRGNKVARGYRETRVDEARFFDGRQ